MIHQIGGILRIVRMPSFNDYGAVPTSGAILCGTLAVLRIPDLHSADRLGFRKIRRDPCRQRKNMFPDRRHGGILHQPFPAGGNHDRVHDKFAAKTGKRPRHRHNDRTGKQHPGLDRGNFKLLAHCPYLELHRRHPDGFDPRNAKRIL